MGREVRGRREGPDEEDVNSARSGIIEETGKENDLSSVLKVNTVYQEIYEQEILGSWNRVH